MSIMYPYKFYSQGRRTRIRTTATTTTISYMRDQKMAVQAQHPSNAFAASASTAADFKDRIAAAVLEDHRLGYTTTFFPNGNNNINLGQILTPTVFSGPQSELTCNASASRKRAREVAAAAADPFPFLPHTTTTVHQNQNFRLASDFTKKPSPISTGLHLCYVDESRMNQSSMTSTSGRTTTISSSVPTPPSTLSPLVQDLVSRLYNQNAEFDALIRLQNERLRSGLEEASKRHCRALLSILENQAQRRLLEKESELETARRKNTELEEKVKQMASENMVWFNVAKNNEAIVTSLRTSLDQAILHNNNATANPATEGYGDSDYLADDAQSCCFDDGEAAARREEGRRTCMGCGDKEVCVLLLPCRHLCLCKDCESKIDTCPVCHSVRNASIQIFLQ